MSASLLEQAVWAAIAAMAFAVLFNVPRRALPACALIAAVAFFARGALLATHLSSLELATLLAAMLAGMLAMAAGKLLHAPAVIFAVPAVVPFVPGALALRATREAIALAAEPAAHLRRETLDALALHDLQIILVIGAMAGGVAVPSLLFRHRRPLT